MASRNAAVADAVKTALNTAAALEEESPFSAAFTAKRIYLPLDDRKDLRNLTVTVLATSDEQTRLNRAGAKMHDITVQIGIRKKLTEAADPSAESANSEIDALTELAEQIADFFGPGQYGGATWMKTEQPVIADHDMLREHRVYFSVVILTFKLGTSA